VLADYALKTYRASMVCANPDYRASHRWYQENKRLLLQHGPIDLVIQAEGDAKECALAFQQAITFFDIVLVSLVDELALLRTRVSDLNGVEFKSVVAHRMLKAVAPYSEYFVTPMAAVAGSVADCTLAAMCVNRSLSRVAVNNGGDIALHLQGNSSYTIGICDNPVSGSQQANAQIHAANPVRGIATSGWHGRSHSLGIADAVTVLAASASQADVAATMIANHIDLPGSNKVERAPASSLSPDSDLGLHEVTVDVQTLTPAECQTALAAGERFAQSLVSKGLMNSAVLTLQDERLVVGHYPSINWKHSA